MRQKQFKRICLFLKFLLLWLLAELVKLLIAVSVAGWVASWAIPAAYAERGYHAIGGEALLIAAAFGVTYYFTCSWLEIQPKRRQIKGRRSGCGRAALPPVQKGA